MRENVTPAVRRLQTAQLRDDQEQEDHDRQARVQQVLPVLAGSTRPHKETR
jgi:hypothetical protein